MSKLKVPCYGCENRHQGCHSSCETYKTFQRENLERNRQIREAKEKDAMITGVKIRSLNKLFGRANVSEHIGGRKGR
jgi:hypothetical protein